MRVFHWTLVLAMLSLAGCGDGGKPAGGDEQAAATKTPPSDHGNKTDLGTLTLAGNKFSIARLGELVPGKEGSFNVRPQGVSADDLTLWNLYLWVENKAGTQVSAPSKGTIEGSSLHFHVTPRDSETPPVRVVLRLRTDEIDERAGLPLDGHGHEHKEGPHHGIPAKFTGNDSGHLELKLHDDKGDLELWLFRDAALTMPFDLPLNESVQIRFIDVNGRTVTLRPRNQEKNEDEDGQPNVRDGRTNYFIYPSRDGEDASWLKGKAFQSIVIVYFPLDGEDSVSEEFILKPHVH